MTNRRDRARFTARTLLNQWDGTGPFGDMLADAMLTFANAELERAAVKCEDYSEVNFEQAGDSILLDPCLRGRGFTPENVAESERQQIKGCVHASQAHAGLHLAELIRAMKEE